MPEHLRSLGVKEKSSLGKRRGHTQRATPGCSVSALSALLVQRVVFTTTDRVDVRKIVACEAPVGMLEAGEATMEGLLGCGWSLGRVRRVHADWEEGTGSSAIVLL